MGKRYTAPTGIHGLRRRIMRWLMQRFSQPVHPSDRPLPIFGIHQILVCRTSHSLGNSLLLTPLLAELERIYPGAEIDIVTQSPIGHELYGKWPSVRKILRLPSRFPPHLLWTWRTLSEMRSVAYDLVIDPDPQSKTGRLLLRMAKGTYKLGYLGSEKHGDVTHGIDADTPVRHVGQVPVHLLRSVIDRRVDLPYPRADIRLDDDEMAMGREKLGKVLGRYVEGTVRRPVIGIFANATGVKRLDPAWWFAMLDHLHALLPEHAIVEFTPVNGQSLLDDRYPTLYCGCPRKLAACLRHLDAFVSVDSGPMHLAWSVGVATFGIFTNTDIAMWGPYGDNGYVVDNQQHTPQGTAELIARRRMDASRTA